MVARPLRSAAFFDLDKTIIAKSSVLAFGRPFYHGGLINRRAVLRSAYAQFVFALAGADEDQIERMRAYLTSMCAGWDVAQVRDIVSETLHEIIDPIVYDEAVELIGMHKAAGRDVVIVSSSGEEVVGPIGAMLGADHVVATRMVVADGKYTGEIELYAYGAEKAVAVRALAAEHATTTCPRATPTPTRPPTCRCSRRSGIRSRSTPTARCAASRPSATGPPSPSPTPSRCASASPACVRNTRRSPRPPSARGSPPAAWSGTPPGAACAARVTSAGPVPTRRAPLASGV